MTPQRGHIREYAPTLDLLFRLADAGIVLAVLMIPCYLSALGPRMVEAYYLLGTTAVIAFYICTELGGLYRVWRGAPLPDECRVVVKCWLWTIPFLLLLGYAAKVSAVYSRLIVLFWFVATPLLLCLWRLILRRLLMALRAEGRNSRSAAIVGTGDLARRVAGAVLASPGSGLRLLGCYDDEAPRGSDPVGAGATAVQGTVADLLARARAGEVDHVYLALPVSQEERIVRITRDLADTPARLYLVPDFMFLDLLHARWTSLHSLPVISVYDGALTGGQHMVKRIEDVVLGSLFLVAAALPLLAIALAIRLTTRGPVLFRQHRYGIDGRPITVWKFRTMTVAEDGADVVQARPGDARVTPIGRFLRRFSLDELPQLFNVLAGHMSLVGPRPHAVAHNEQYRRLIHGYMLRHRVKPGVTGLAQVNGCRGETDTVEKMQRRIDYDLEYLRTWSLMLDLRILARTVAVVLRGTAA